MRLYRIPAICVAMIAFSMTANAASITVSLVQNEEAPAIAIEMSRTIEDEILGDYFDAGHIVSTADIRTDGSAFAKLNFGIKEAAFGFSDYLLAVYLVYGPGELTDSEKKLTYAELRSITWRLVEVSSSRVIDEKSIDVTKIKVTDFDPFKQSRLVADRISAASIPDIGK